MKVELSSVEEAFLALLLADHARQVGEADATKQTRLNVLLKEKGVPDGVSVKILARTAEGPAALEYEA